MFFLLLYDVNGTSFSAFFIQKMDKSIVDFGIVLKFREFGDVKKIELLSSGQNCRDDRVD